MTWAILSAINAMQSSPCIIWTCSCRGKSVRAETRGNLANRACFLFHKSHGITYPSPRQTDVKPLHSQAVCDEPVCKARIAAKMNHQGESSQARVREEVDPDALQYQARNAAAFGFSNVINLRPRDVMKIEPRYAATYGR
jgi:hypothetical protein